MGCGWYRKATVSHYNELSELLLKEKTMKIRGAKQACTAYENHTRNPFALHAKQRKAGIEKPKKGRGSYERKKKHKVDLLV